MIVSINPSYKCNFSCSHCYLSKTQLKDSTKIDLKDLRIALDKINDFKKIEHIDFYGGEIGILPFLYLIKLHSLFKKYVDKINVITNLFIVNPYFNFEDVSLSVSYDFIFRQSHEKVFDNMCSLNKEISVLTLAIPSILKMDISKFIDKLNSCKNVRSLEIKKYSSSLNNNFSYDSYQLDYESFILKLLDKEKDMNFKFINKDLIENSISKKYNAFSNNHLYVTPQNKIAVLDFDKDNKEYFKILKDLNEYKDWCENEKKRVHKNEFCNKCEFKGHCLTEHIRLPDKSNYINSCDGAYLLLKNVRL